MCLPVFAGTPSKAVIPPPPPPAEPSLWNWFIGASAGYLVDFEEPMYHVHVGVDTPWNVGGFDVALFAELGYTEKSENFSFLVQDPQMSAPVFITQQGKASVDIIPLTFNVKLERPIAQNLNFYVGAGLGVAFVDLKVSSPSGSVSDDDTVFAAQAFAGLVYNVSPAFEVYGGARWIYLDDGDLFGSSADFGDDVLLELGLRYNF